jgi:sec-independent protein translocase protein TatB
LFDIGTGELIALAVLALLVLGPDKLPRYAADAARFIRQIRNMANDARDEVTRELGPEMQGLGLRDINPRALMRKHLFEGLDDDDDDAADDEPVRRTPRERPEASTTSEAPYDPDTT